LIVVDDGSTDGSIEKLKILKERYEFVLIIQNNKGLSKTLTDTIKNYTNGKYISICASDDYWHPEKIESQVVYMQKNQQYPMCFSKCYYVDESSELCSNRSLYSSESVYRSGNIFDDLLLLKYHLPVSYMYTREILEEINFFPDNIYCEDYYMNLKISENYQIGYIDRYLLYYRFQQNSPEKALKIIESQRQILENYNSHNLYKKSINQWRIRAVYNLSNYPQYKKYCFEILKKVRPSVDSRYWKGLVKLLVK